MEFSYGTYNFRNGGIDDGGDARLRRQLAMLAGAGADGWAFQECKGWRAHRYRAFFLAEKVLGMRGFLAESAHYGCDVGVFVRESAGIRVTGVEHEEGWPYFHAVACVFTEVQGFPLLLASAHFAPSSPAVRLGEAEEFRLVMKRGTLACGFDWNAVPDGDPDPDVTGIDPDVARRKLDRSASRALKKSGLADVGAHVGDLTPTVGHAGPGKLAHRGDGIGTTLPPWCIAGYRVVPGDDRDSDHKAAVAAFDLPVPAGTR